MQVLNHIFKFFSVDIDFHRFEEDHKSLKGNTNRKIFQPGQQMTGNTNREKTSPEFKEVVEAHGQGSQEEQPQPSAAIFHCKSGYMIVNLSVHACKHCWCGSLGTQRSNRTNHSPLTHMYNNSPWYLFQNDGYSVCSRTVMLDRSSGQLLVLALLTIWVSHFMNLCATCICGSR